MLEKVSLARLDDISSCSLLLTNPYARQLAQRFAGLPMALASGGAYLRRAGFMSFKAYLEAYNRSWNVDPTRSFQLQQYREYTLRTTWNISYAQLSQEDPDAAQLLKLFACFDNREIWYELVSAGEVISLHSKPRSSSFRRLLSRPRKLPDPDESPVSLQQLLHDRARFETAMSRLVQYCFIEVETQPKLYSLHGCVHDWVTEELNRTPDPDIFWHVVRCVFDRIEVKRRLFNDTRSLPFANLVPHAARVSRYAHTRCQRGVEIPSDHDSKLRRIALLLYYHVYGREAEELYLWILGRRPMKVDSFDKTTVRVLRYLGDLYSSLQQYEAAEKTFEQALKYSKSKSDSGSNLMREVMHSLARLKMKQNNLTEAEAIILRVLKEQDQVLDPSHSETLLIMSTMGTIYQTQGRLEEAEQMLLRAFTGMKANKESTGRMFDPAFHLADVYYLQARYKDAEAICIPLVSEFEENLGPQNSVTILAVEKLVAIYRAAQGKETEANDVERQFRSI